MWRVLGLSLMTFLLWACTGSSTPEGGAKGDAGEMMYKIDHKRADEHEYTG